MEADVVLRLIRRCIETRKFRKIHFSHKFFYFNGKKQFFPLKLKKIFGKNKYFSKFADLSPKYFFVYIDVLV